MTICVVCDVLGRENNGTTIAAMNLIRSLRGKGHTVRVVCPDKDRAGEPDCFVVPALPTGPFKHYIKENGVVIGRSDRETVEKALDGADHVHLMTPFFLCTQALRMATERGISVTAGFHCQAENLTSHFFMKNWSSANRLTYR